MKKHLIFDLDGTLIQSMDNFFNIVNNYFKEIKGTDISKVEYIFKTTPGMALETQIELIYEGVENINKKKIKNDIYTLLLNSESKFIDGAINKILELSKSYNLYLTTGNSTQVAHKELKIGGIFNKFELIYGSDQILKGMEHLNIFKEHSLDNDFFKNSVYIGDGVSDRIYANEAGIDFIHIGDNEEDKYEIKSVSEIDNILTIINKIG